MFEPEQLTAVPFACEMTAPQWKWTEEIVNWYCLGRQLSQRYVQPWQSWISRLRRSHFSRSLTLMNQCITKMLKRGRYKRGLPMRSREGDASAGSERATSIRWANIIRGSSTSLSCESGYNRATQFEGRASSEEPLLKVPLKK